MTRVLLQVSDVIDELAFYQLSPTVKSLPLDIIQISPGEIQSGAE